MRGSTMGTFEHPVDSVSVSHYDLVLAVIPSVFVVGVLVGNLLSVPTSVAVAGAAVVALLALADALFVHPPVGGS